MRQQHAGKHAGGACGQACGVRGVAKDVERREPQHAPSACRQAYGGGLRRGRWRNMSGEMLREMWCNICVSLRKSRQRRIGRVARREWSVGKSQVAPRASKSALGRLLGAHEDSAIRFAGGQRCIGQVAAREASADRFAGRQKCIGQAARCAGGVHSSFCGRAEMHWAGCSFLMGYFRDPPPPSPFS